MKYDFLNDNTKKSSGFFGNNGIMRIILILLSSLIVIFMTPWIVVFCFSILELCGLDPDHAAIIKDNGELFVAIIATIAILYQLRQTKNSEDRLKDIEEAKFILQYNQAFIENQRICEIEALIEKQMEEKIKTPIITEENRQDFINYLVYLEGLSTTIDRGILKIKNMDNLFAYRFFLAMNNKELQEDQICKYPDYFRGSIKLYNTWSDYRIEKKRSILMEDTSLDKWLKFEDYIDHDVKVRRYAKGDSLKDISKILYQTDRYIYPAAFKNPTMAKKVLPKLFNMKNSIFSTDNIFVAIYNNKIVGAAIVLSNKIYEKVDDSFINKYKRRLPGFIDVNNNYFNKLLDHQSSTSIMCLSMDAPYRKQRIGTILFKKIIRNHQSKDITLQVLKQYSSTKSDAVSPAIKLYQNCGFVITNELDGYSPTGNTPPRVYNMKRIATSDKDEEIEDTEK